MKQIHKEAEDMLRNISKDHGIILITLDFEEKDSNKALKYISNMNEEVTKDILKTISKRPGITFKG